MKASFFKITQTRIYLGIAMALIILLGMMVMGYITTQERQGRFENVMHSFEVLSKLHNLEVEITEMGRYRRTFLITDKTEYKERYLETSKKIFEIEKQYKDFPEIKDDLYVLKELYDSNNELASAKKYIPSNADISNKLIAQIRARLSILVKKERVRLSDNLERHEYYQNQTNTIMSTASAMAFFMVLFASCLIVLEFRKRSQIQKSLNETLEIQKTILNSAAFAIIAGDAKGHINLFNPAAERLLGYKAEEVIGKSPEIFHVREEVERKARELSEKYQEYVPAGYETFIYRARKGYTDSDEYTYRRKDGTLIPVSLSVSAQTNDYGVVTGYVGLAYDISKELQYKNEILKAKELAEAGTRAKSEFLANISHEIRTPINAILGMAELLKETPLNEEQNKYVEIFHRSGEGLLNLIEDILDLSKIEAGHLNLNKQPFNLGELVQKTVEIISVKAQQKNLDLKIDISSEIDKKFVGDENRIGQILLNLLGNAIKFTRQGQVLLKVSTSEKKGKYHNVCLEIHDTGIGMTEEQMKQLFGRFSQADSSITKEFGGTGLGLNISKKLVELMNGNIEVESTFGKGSIFKVTLPLEIDGDLASDDLKPEEKFLFGKLLRILLVDDNDENRLVIKAFLRPFDWEIVEAKNGKEALEFFHENEFDLILMDMQMPVMDGYTATLEIRKKESISKRKITPIIALTAYALSTEVSKSIEAGCNDHLSKPVSKKNLLKAIQEHTGKITIEIDDDLADIIPEFLERRVTELWEMKSLLEKEDFNTLHVMGHKLKGAAGSYGFMELSHIGKVIEDKSLEKDQVSIKHALLRYQFYLERLIVQ